jgi:hypothetical protein
MSTIKKTLFEYGLDNYVYKKLGFYATDSQRRTAIMEYYGIPIYLKETKINNFTFYSFHHNKFSWGDNITLLMERMKDHLIYINEKVFSSEIIDCLIPFIFIDEKSGMRYTHGFNNNDEIVYREEIDKLIQITKPSQHFSYNALVFTMNNVKLRRLKIQEILND